MRSIVRHALLLISFLACIGPHAFAEVLHVPGTFETIQQAINAAAPGDEVVLADGTYTGSGNKNLDFGGKDITVRSASGDPTKCIIDCEGDGRGFFFHNGETPAAVVAGLTITNGRAIHSPAFGASGGGILVVESAPTINRNILRFNQASKGGALYVNAGASLVVGNRFISNRAGWAGGAIAADFSNLTLANNTFAGNGGPDGGALAADESTLLITGNTIVGNTAIGYGGAARFIRGSAIVLNTIISFNSSGFLVYDTSTVVTFRGNCIFGNNGKDFFGVADPAGSNGNISVNPRLADPVYGNVHLLPDSPCIDAGTTIDTIGLTDIDGEPRIWPDGGRVDIGADESTGAAWQCGPYTIVRAAPDGDDANDGSTWATAKRSAQAAVNAAAVLGGDVWVKEGTYDEHLTLHPFAHVYGGFTGHEESPAERTLWKHPSTLDGGGTFFVVKVYSGFHASRLDGFRVTNGGPPWGGGIFIHGASLPVRNNHITANAGCGILALGSHGDISDNLITYNSAVDGGGIFSEGGGLLISRNTIRGNSAENLGGGILTLFGDSPRIVQNKIVGNRAGFGGGTGAYYYRTPPDSPRGLHRASKFGGVQYCELGLPTLIENNLIVGNVAFQGGGIFTELACDWLAVTNNIILGNRALQGGGIADIVTSAAMTNNTIVFNSADNAGGGLYTHESDTTHTNSIIAFNSSGVHATYWWRPLLPTFRNVSVSENVAYDYFGMTDPSGTNGNISAAPRFVRTPSDGGDGWGDDPDTLDVDEGANDDFGDLRLIPASPCIDAGDNASVPPDAADLDGDGNVAEPTPLDFAGQPRFIDDLFTPDPGLGTSPIVDMGAYETPSRGDCAADGTLDLNDTNAFVNCISGVDFPTSGYCECADIDFDSDSDLRDFSILQRALR